MKRLLNIIIVLLICCYPFAVYFGLNHFPIRYIGLVIAFIFLLRYLLLNQSKAPSKKSTITLTIIGIAACLIAVLSNHALAIKLYPVIASFFMFSVFFYSLSHPPSIIERLARLKEKNLSTEAISYSHQLTKIWCGFFIINGIIAIWTVFFAPLSIWTLYNGLISYLLMGALFVGELLIRPLIKRCRQSA